MRLQARQQALVAATAAAGGALLVAAAHHAAALPLATLALFGAAAVFTELIEVPPDETSFDPRDTTSFAFSASIHTAAVVVLGPWAAAAVAAFGVLGADGLRRRPLPQVCFNAATAALATWAGGQVFGLLGGKTGSLHLPADFLAVAGCAAVAYVVGGILVSAVVALGEGQPFASTARETLPLGVATSLGEAGLGIALAAFALTEPWAAVALLPLVLAVYHAHERLVTLRRETARALETFANVVDERDPYTYEHSARVAEHVRALAEALALPPRTVAQLRSAGHLHDLGKIAIDASVLRKPGKLAGEEWEAMRLHPRLSARLLRRFRLASAQAKAVEYHHERFDGDGYYGIAPVDVPLAAHFLVIADSFDAMTSDRPYRSGLAVETALAEIERGAGTQFHPVLAQAFVALQRGEEPLAVLAPEELRTVRRLAGAEERADRRKVAPSTEQVATGSLLAALVAVGLGVPILAVPALGLALVAFAAGRLRELRAGHVAGAVADALAGGASRDRLLDVLAARLAPECELSSLAFLSWSERECRGAVELEWRGGATSASDGALTSWIVRESETSGPLVAAGSELGRIHPHLAVPLAREGSIAGFLLLSASGGVPRPVRDGLVARADAIAERLLGAPVPARGRLEAVAG